MLCLKCGYDMGNRRECPICGYSTEKPEEMHKSDQIDEGNVNLINKKENDMNRKEKTIFLTCGVGLVVSVICLVWVLKHFACTTHMWFENAYNEVFYDNVRVTSDRNTMLAVSNSGILGYEYGEFVLRDLKGRKKNVSFDLNGQIVQVLVSDSNEYIGVITNLQNQLTLSLIKIQDAGNIVVDNNIDIEKLLYINDSGNVFYTNKAGEFVCWNNKNKQVIGSKITKCIAFEESNSMYFLQENKELYKISLKGGSQPKKVKSNVLSISAKRENSWKNIIENNGIIIFGYLEDELIKNTTQQQDETEDMVKDENYSYGINEKKQLYKKDSIDGEITILREGVIDFGIR